MISLTAAQPGLPGDEIYERARSRVGAEIQAITYNEFLPLLLGRGALPPYTGYDPDTDPGIANEFSTAAYRFGHSMLSPSMLRWPADAPPDALSLRECFFDPPLLALSGIEPFLRGAARQVAQALDPQMVEDVRSFLFGPPGSGGFDLASLNIQRGRDHGLAGYNDVRAGLGLDRLGSFEEITSDPAAAARLASVYADVDEVDLWVGGLAEDPADGALVGETFHRILSSQFRRMRDGDRFWYQRVFSGSELAELESLRLSAVLKRNPLLNDLSDLSDYAFFVPEPGQTGSAALAAATLAALVRRRRRALTSADRSGDAGRAA